MRTVILNYTFSKSSRQITLTDYVSISLSNLFLIVDVTNGQTIFQANDLSLGGTVGGNVVTLTYDTTGAAFNDSDVLQIFYEVDTLPVSAASVPLPVAGAL